MKTKIFMLFFLSVIFFSAFSCSSFVYDSENISVRGMNFDYPGNPEIMLSYPYSDEYSFFALSFDTKSPVGYAYMLGINEKGIFTTTQMLSKQYVKASRGAKIFIHDVFMDVLRHGDSVEYIESRINGKRVIFSPNFYTHILVSDSNKNATVLEVSPDENVLIKKEGEKFAMTNFCLYNFNYRDISSIHGPGDENYRNMWKKIDEIGEIDTLEKALEILKASLSKTTCSSTVYFPEQDTVYIAFDGNFDRLWKINPGLKTIETHTGFEEHRTETIGTAGILKSALDEWK